MAEARSAVAELRLMLARDLDDRKPTWKDVLYSLRKSCFRRYYRIRNSIRNGVWPASPSNLGTVCAILLILLLSEPAATDSFNRWLWKVEEWLHLPQGLPRLFKAIVIAFVLGVNFFVVVTTVRLYLLRILLSFRGWMYEQLRRPSVKTITWSIMVRLVSGYHQSLYSCQRSLPRMPVPALQDTVDKLMVSLAPLCDKEELAELEHMAKEFTGGVGSKVQKILILKSWWASNYVSDWWEKYVYLMSRSPLAINSNYYILDHSYWTPTTNQVSRAAQIVYSCLTFKRSIDREELPPLVIRKTIPICMAQYERIFSTTRIPGEDLDELMHFDSKDSRHLIVMRRGLFYRVDVYDSKNQLLAPSNLEQQFQWIMDDADVQYNNFSDEERALPVLTALERSEWARTRKQFFNRGINRETMDVIERAIFCVTLSEESPKTLNERGKCLLHGDAKSIWFDKSQSYIFFANGKAGANCEHALADAPALGHVWEYAMTREVLERVYSEDGRCMPLTTKFRQGTFVKPRRLVWDVSAALATKVQNAIKFAKSNLEDLDLEIGDHDAWGKGFIKKCKVSPDAFIQLALQLAYYRDAGQFAQTYEASMTRLYLNGRTETVRSCTNETANFVKAMEDSSVSMEERIRLLRIAADRHQSLYRDAMNGMGIDRHLFALYVGCRGIGYDSKFLKKVLSRPWTLSTSQQPHQQLTDVPDVNLPIFQDKLGPGGGFGPVSDNGYGVSYMLSCDSKFFFHVSSKHSSAQTSSRKFLRQIFTSLADIKALFD